MGERVSFLLHNEYYGTYKNCFNFESSFKTFSLESRKREISMSAEVLHRFLHILVLKRGQTIQKSLQQNRAHFIFYTLDMGF